MSQFIEMFGKATERVALSSLCDTFIDGDWIEAKDQSDSGIRLIQTGNVGVGVYKDKEDKARYISEETFNRLNCTEVFEGDILISRLPDPVGRACSIPGGLSKSITAVDCTIIRLNEKVLPKYFISFTNTPDYAMQIKKVLSGTTRLRVSRANLGKIQVPLPSKDEQQRFVEIANQADKSEFGDIKSQFIEEIGDPRTNPKNWPIKKLSELSTYSIGLTYKPEDVSKDGIIVLRSGNIQESKLTLTDTVRVNCQIKESLYVKEDDILMCSRNGSAALVGKVAQIKSIDEPMTYGAFMTIIRSEYSDYLFLYFQSNAFREQVSTGKSSTMNQITQKMLDKICLPFPDEDTRKRLSAILHQADKSEYKELEVNLTSKVTKV